MACRFEYNGKTYDQDGLAKALEAMPPHEASKYIPSVQSIPDAPFKKTWHELALKQMLREAAEGGYDRLSWTPGEAQAARYDLSKQVDKVNLVPHESVMNGGKVNFRIDAFKDNQKLIEHYVKDENEAASVIGKEAAKKLFENRNQHGASTLVGQDLKIGGEGMKGFYDKMLPDYLNKIGKEHGVKVEKGMLGEAIKIDKSINSKGEYVVHKNGSEMGVFKTREDAQQLVDELIEGNNGTSPTPIHYIDLPQSLKDQALHKGFPLFSAAGIPLTPVEHDPFERKHKLVPVNHDPFDNSNKSK